MLNKKYYQPKDKVMWDTWFLKDDETYHSFYLQSLMPKDPNSRHDNCVSVGHAKSKNLIDWEELPTALVPGKEGEWDNVSLWSGSVIKKDDKYYLFYTGIKNDGENKNIQKIGLAISDDLIKWEKINNNPILEVKSKDYVDSFQKNSLGNIGAWRDPYVFWDEKNKKYYMTISARDKKFGGKYNGCVALASSDNLIDWEIHKPIFSPGIFDEIETTQMIIQDGIYYLFFSTHESIDSKTKNSTLKNGLYCFYSDKIDGEYKPIGEDGLVLDYYQGIYNVRLIHKEDKEYYAIGWLNESANSKFLGKMPGSMNIKIDKDNIFFT